MSDKASSMNLSSIDKVRKFMFDDIDKTIQLAHTPRGAPNFLLALGLCCYTEYWARRKHLKHFSNGSIFFIMKGYYEH
ncbi:MAG: hypothetical protein JO297_03410 [Nitrososphaeraceae archaeon]|nr:hypothetical protein [Nitrososphaeraceae archaeon]